MKQEKRIIHKKRRNTFRIMVWPVQLSVFFMSQNEGNSILLLFKVIFLGILTESNIKRFIKSDGVSITRLSPFLNKFEKIVVKIFWTFFDFCSKSITFSLNKNLGKLYLALENKVKVNRSSSLIVPVRLHEWFYNALWKVEVKNFIRIQIKVFTLNFWFCMFMFSFTLVLSSLESTKFSIFIKNFK